jgi:hypothetical protein
VVVNPVRRACDGGSDALETARWRIHGGQTPPHRDPIALWCTLSLCVCCRIRRAGPVVADPVSRAHDSVDVGCHPC